MAYPQLPADPDTDVYLYTHMDEKLRPLTSDEYNALVQLTREEHLRRHEEITADPSYFHIVVEGEKWFLYHDSIYPASGNRERRYQAAGVSMDLMHIGHAGVDEPYVDLSELVAWAERR